MRTTKVNNMEKYKKDKINILIAWMDILGEVYDILDGIEYNEIVLNDNELRLFCNRARFLREDILNLRDERIANYLWIKQQELKSKSK